jgi:ComF family protein
MRAVKSAVKNLTHLFFPRICAGCGSDIVSEQQLLCFHCIDRLPVSNFHMHANNPVEKIFWGRLPLATAFSYLFFTKQSILQHLLHQFKYGGKKEIGEYFGKRMGEAMLQSNRFIDIDAVVPLPLFLKKERIRGYNQAAVIGEGISLATGIPLYNDVARRKMFTETQTHKSRMERWQNIEGKFEVINESKIEHKHLLLIDDVVTTGATLEACGSVLLEQPGVRLSIATLAYTTL